MVSTPEEKMPFITAHIEHVPKMFLIDMGSNRSLLTYNDYKQITHTLPNGQKVQDIACQGFSRDSSDVMFA